MNKRCPHCGASEEHWGFEDVSHPVDVDPAPAEVDDFVREILTEELAALRLSPDVVARVVHRLAKAVRRQIH
jgi:hypothetical protein